MLKLKRNVSDHVAKLFDGVLRVLSTSFTAVVFTAHPCRLLLLEVAQNANCVICVIRDPPPLNFHRNQPSSTMADHGAASAASPPTKTGHRSTGKRELAALSTSDDYGGRRKSASTRKHPPRPPIVPTAADLIEAGPKPRPVRNKAATLPADPNPVVEHTNYETGTRLVEMDKLCEAVSNIACCRKCVEKENEAYVHGFIEYCAKMKKRGKYTDDRDMLRQYHESRSKNPKKICCPLQVTTTQHGFATDVTFACTSNSGKHSVTAAAGKVPTDILSEPHLQHARYGMNHRVVAYHHHCGRGPEHADALAGFLNLPPAANYSKVFKSTEEEYGRAVQDNAQQSMDDAVELEKMATIWKRQEDGESPFDRNGRVGIDISFDGHWPKAGNRRSFNSPASGGYGIGTMTRLIVAAHICCQVCRIHTFYHRKKRAGNLKEGEQPRRHR